MQSKFSLLGQIWGAETFPVMNTFSEVFVVIETVRNLIFKKSIEKSPGGLSMSWKLFKDFLYTVYWNLSGVGQAAQISLSVWRLYNTKDDFIFNIKNLWNRFEGQSKTILAHKATVDHDISNKTGNWKFSQNFQHKMLF